MSIVHLVDTLVEFIIYTECVEDFGISRDGSFGPAEKEDHRPIGKDAPCKCFADDPGTCLEGAISLDSAVQKVRLEIRHICSCRAVGLDLQGLVMSRHED